MAVVSSNNPHFRDDAATKDARIQDVGRSVQPAAKLKAQPADTSPVSGPARPLLRAPSVAADPLASPAVDLSTLQWDMQQIQAPDAHAINRGSRAVLVGDIDTGVDAKHPDLKPNLDVASSVSCLGGAPDQSPAAWDDDVGHGTHTAGLIAAAGAPGRLAGVAPNVRIAAIRAGDSNGFFFPEAVVCAFMWAATHHVAITNNSYFADPFFFNCPSDPQQRAILTAELRAIAFAELSGVAVIAALDNFSDDLANPTQDVHSPTNGTPVVRPVDRTCLIMPAEAPGAIGVSSTGNLKQKAASSNYGLGIVEVAGPGGDSRLQRDATIGGGRVLSTWPLKLQAACPRQVTAATGDPDEPTAVYCYQQGTSMAAPHVAGVAALILSQQAGFDGGGGSLLQLALLQSMLARSTDPIACPSPDVLATYAPFPSLDNGAPQACQGTPTYNSWYGFGEVNASVAVRTTFGLSLGGN